MSSITEDSVKIQEARALLREQFLNDIIQLTGQQCKILTYEQTELEATFNGWNPDGSEMLVRDLKTPAFTNLSSAILRTPDVIAVKFDNEETNEGA